MFSEKIKEIRSKHNMTQEDLANKLFVTRNAVSKWKTNKGLPSVETLKDVKQKEKNLYYKDSNLNHKQIGLQTFSIVRYYIITLK